jgi:hypothetical protein
MMLRICLSALLLLTLVCMPEKVTPLLLQIIQPPYYADRVDTIHTDTIPVEGETSVGATIYIGATYNPTAQATVDPVGHFAGKIVVTDENGLYSVFIKASMVNHTPIVESRSVYYQRLP